MKSRINITVALCFTICIAIGCSDKAPPLNQSTAAEMDAAKKEHDYFAKVNGNFGALSPQDQASFNQLAGGSASGQATWKIMMQHNSFPSGSGASGGSPTSHRP